MKALKLMAILCTVVLLALGGFVLYFFKTANVEIVSIQSEGISLSQDSDLFQDVVDKVQNQTFIGTIFQKPTEWKHADDYIILNYTIHLKNGCLVPIDMIEIQIVPKSEDILQFGNSSINSLSEKAEEDFSASILTSKESNAVREIIVTYYVWGISFSLRTTAKGI